MTLVQFAYTTQQTLSEVWHNKFRSFLSFDNGPIAVLSETHATSALKLLVQAIKGEIDHIVRDEGLKKSKVKYRRSRIEKFDYDYKTGSINYGSVFENLERDEWSLAVPFQIIEQIKKTSWYKAQIKEIIPVIAEACGTGGNDGRIEGFLTRYLVPGVVQMLLSGSSEEQLEPYLDIFIRDLKDKPVEWNCKIWLHGILLRDDAYEIFDKLRIRRTSPSDLESVQPADYLFDAWSARVLEGTTPVIVELTYASQEKQLGHRREQIVDCLRLFQLGSVFSQRTETTSRSFVHRGGWQSAGRFPATQYKYCISSADIPKLRRFIQTVDKLLPESCNQEEATPLCVLCRGTRMRYYRQRLWRAVLLPQ